MGAYVEAHVLSIVLLVPALTALGLLGSGTFVSVLFNSRGLPGEIWRVVGLGASGVTFALVLVHVLVGFDPEHIGLQRVEYVPWVESIGVSYFVGVDGISLFLVVLTSGLVPLVLLASWRQVDRSLRSFVFYLLLLESGLLTVFLAQNVVLYFVGWQATVVPMFFLIGIWGGSRRVRAATRFLVVSGMGSAVLLVALLSLVGTNADPGIETAASGFDWVSPPGSSLPGLVDVPAASGHPVAAGAIDQTWLFLAFVLAFGLAIPIVPLHAWLPDAQSEAPTAVTAMLAAVGVKMGAYGMLRFALPLCPDAAAEWGPALVGIALTGILYGSLLATVQGDLKRLIAWWTIAQLGFVLLGTFSLDVHGMTGAVVAMSSHGLIVAAFLFLVGAVAERRGSSEITAYGGLARPMPVFAALLGSVTLAAMGVPMLSGFVGEWLVVLSGFGVDARVGLLATGGWVIGAGCLAWAYRRVVLGPVLNPENRGLIDLDWRERGVVLVLLLPILWVGVYPGPVLRRIEPSVLELMRQMDDRRVVPPISAHPLEAVPERAGDADAAGEGV